MSAVGAGASMSACGTYRYALWRDWGDPDDLFRSEDSWGRVCWIMLNPSTADAEEDDPTIRRCTGFSKAWGYSGIVVVNLFAYRATKPADLMYAQDAVGPDNDAAILEAIDSPNTGIVVCAWGANATKKREREVMALLRRPRRSVCALRLTKSGSPAHPLYLPGGHLPVPFQMENR